MQQFCKSLWTFFNGSIECTIVVCDASCLPHDECCKDFEKVCVLVNIRSCSGRCGEWFRRGRLCECDSGCVRYDTCCRDYQNHCSTSNSYLYEDSLQHFFMISDNANSNPDLCSDLPIRLANGTILIFKCHFFWTMDPRTKALCPARNVTEEFGIPSPIDSAITRTNCQGKSYWRMANGKMEPGYPKSVASSFDGLTGTITAALSVPVNRRRPESVYFFKKRGTMQKYSYPAGSSPVCGKKSKSSTKKPHGHRAAVRLGVEINIKPSLKGFPSSVTSAVSVPSAKKADRYKYFLFISGDLPALAKPDNPDPRQNSINWLKCV
uniref:Proteoglycan 4a n=1 Tax=Oncorhynchus mykiss TaxID=8022 RepID=A0A8C7UIJ8_ONCMY